MTKGLIKEDSSIKVKEINLNHESVFLSRFPFGKTQKVPVKLGRKNYYMDVSKTSNSADICLYLRSAKSKYDMNAEKKGVFVKNDAMLTKDFFEKLGDIEKSQAIYWKYKEILNY